MPLMKNKSLFARPVRTLLALATSAATSAAISAYAQGVPTEQASYLKSLKDSTGTALTFELTKKMGAASWYCGSDLAKQVYEDVMNGRAPTIPASSSNDCRIESGYMIMAMGEIRNRAASAAASAAKDAVEGSAAKINDAIAEKLGVPKTPAVSNFAKLYITFGQTKGFPSTD